MLNFSWKGNTYIVTGDFPESQHKDMLWLIETKQYKLLENRLINGLVTGVFQKI